MAETISRTKSAHPFGRDDTPSGRPRSQSPPTDGPSLRPRPQPKYGGFPDDGKPKPLRILTNGLTIDPSGNSIQYQSDSPPTQLPASVDPLSRHIIQRTGSTAPPLSNPRRVAENIPPGSDVTDRGVLKSAVDYIRDQDGDQASKEKKKGVSFRSLRRLIASKREEQHQEPIPEQSEIIDERPEGANAEVFTEHVDNIGYSPKHPQPPAYIRVRSSGKKERDFNRLFVAQELQEQAPKALARTGSTLSQNRIRRKGPQTGEATWAMCFSMDGQYLATAGQDQTVKVWRVLSSAQERGDHEKDEEADGGTVGPSVHLSAPVFRKKPIQVYEGHTAPVLDLSWSKNNFLLSSSMDKTVRLWHASRPECLCAFKHNDYVTSIQFHPRDDRFFLAGSLDAKLRLWSIPDKSVAFWIQLPEMITAVSFTPDGKTAIAGCLSGLCLFYETEGLKYQTQIHVRSTHGKNSKGSKITGIETINIPPTDPNGEVKMLITSNDSRVRLYNFRDKSLEVKFKGNENSSSQIKARFSDDAKYIVCGSEDARVFLWDVHCPDFERKNKARVEAFEAHNAATTVSLFAPVRTRQLLSSSEDPLYDLCNPPPVTLLSKAERESLHSSRAQSDKGNVVSPTGSMHTRHDDNPSYVSRCNHPDGHIIVTGDAAGVIKVFRQDCAFEKRQAWDTVSLHSSKRFGLGGANNASGTLDGRSRQSSNATQPPGERILSWRQEVMRRGSVASSTSLGTNGGGNTASQAGTIGRPTAGGSTHSPISAGGRYTPVRSPASIDSFNTKKPSPPLSTVAQTQSQQQQPLPSASAQTEQSREPVQPNQSPPVILISTDSGVQNAHDPSTGGEVQPEQPSPAPSPGEEHVPHNDRRRNSDEYWEHSAWRDDAVEQLRHMPRGQLLRYDSTVASTPGLSRAGSREEVPRVDGTSPPRPGGQRVGNKGLMGVPMPSLQRGVSHVSALTDELTSAEASEVEDQGGPGPQAGRAPARGYGG